MRRLLSIPGITIALFLVWKVALLLFTAQPVPSNDSFFYDGPVVNYLVHGKYCNPSLAQVLPISGTKVFSAYPPLYQAVLLGWMKCFGTSVLAAMWFHVVLLVVFAATILTIFHELKLPASAVNFAGFFLFGITFHDRPDTLAHVLGAITILAAVRGLFWPAAVFQLLVFCTSLQIGGIYLLWCAGLVVGNVWWGKIKFPWAIALTFFATLSGLIVLVKYGHPLWWEGFREHVKITPSVTGLRIPRVDDLLKIIRTAPGILLAMTGFTWVLIKATKAKVQLRESQVLLVSVTGILAAVALISGCLFILTPNTIHIAGYLQPVIVGCFLAVADFHIKTWLSKLVVQFLCLGAVLLVSLRAVGMTLWGILCARDVNQQQALVAVQRSLDSAAADSHAFVSAAYLYAASVRPDLNVIHSDWPALDVGLGWELQAIEKLQPTRLILTQFDYYRRYEAVVAEFSRQRGDVAVRIDNLARVQPPDAIPATRKIVQHIAWAPVIIEIEWPTALQQNSTHQIKP